MDYVTAEDVALRESGQVEAGDDAEIVPSTFQSPEKVGKRGLVCVGELSGCKDNLKRELKDCLTALDVRTNFKIDNIVTRPAYAWCEIGDSAT